MLPEESPNKSNPLDLIRFGAEKTPNHKDEAKAELELEKLFGEHERGEDVKNQIHSLIIVLLKITFVVAIALMSVRATILILPQDWNWLNEKQIMQLDALAKYAVSSAVGALVTKYLNRNVEK